MEFKISGWEIVKIAICDKYHDETKLGNMKDKLQLKGAFSDLWSSLGKEENEKEQTWEKQRWEYLEEEQAGCV